VLVGVVDFGERLLFGADPFVGGARSVDLTVREDEFQSAAANMTPLRVEEHDAQPCERRGT
jgi:hypothetical protein